MSRTYRRKNAWDKKNHTESWHLQSLFTTVELGEDYHMAGKGAYHGMTEEQKAKKANALYHAETPRNWNHKAWGKEFSRGRLRAANTAELHKFFATGEEPIFTNKKDIDCQYWFYWD